MGDFLVVIEPAGVKIKEGDLLSAMGSGKS